MKMREIILDFTSLLDVMMIILFWFIINSRQQMQEQITTAEQTASVAVAMANEQTAQAEALQEEAENLKLQAEQEFAVMEHSAQASNIQAIRDFSQGSIQIRLVMMTEGWKIEVYQGDTFLESISDRRSQQIGLELNRIFQSVGYLPDDTILCIFTFDSSESGTRWAYAEITEAFRLIQLGNKRFYYTEVDTAITEGSETE
ncbi:MAG TPA: hypothetical protein DCO72_02045 [Ruminococcus sp.]|nr:hypothetical protein [Ruminococcus sp.]